MDPVAYQSFEDSPIPPKHRPTTHVRVASGVHSFGQEFLGFPPEEGVSSFADSTATGSTSSVATVAMADDSGTAAESEGVAAPSAKIPGVGTRMTVIRLQNGEVREDAGGY